METTCCDGGREIGSMSGCKSTPNGACQTKHSCPSPARECGSGGKTTKGGTKVSSMAQLQKMAKRDKGNNKAKADTSVTVSEAQLINIIKRTINESQLLLERPCVGVDDCDGLDSCCEHTNGTNYTFAMGCLGSAGEGACTSQCERQGSQTVDDEHCAGLSGGQTVDAERETSSGGSSIGNKPSTVGSTKADASVAVSESQLINIIKRTINESQLLNEAEPCSAEKEGTSCSWWEVHNTGGGKAHCGTWGGDRCRCSGDGGTDCGKTTGRGPKGTTMHTVKIGSTYYSKDKSDTITVSESELIDSIERIVKEQSIALGLGNMGGISLGVSKPTDKYKDLEEDYDEELEEDYDEDTIHPGYGQVTQAPHQVAAPDGMGIFERKLTNKIRKLVGEAKKKGKCPASGCIKKVGNKWRVISNKTGKLWPAHYSSKKDAEDGLDAYHANK